MQPPIARSAMTLIEVIMVSALLAAIAVAVLAFTRQPGDRVKDNACQLNAVRLQVLVDQYRLDYGHLPSRTMSELVQPRYVGGDLPLCPVDGSRYTLDTQTGQVINHSH